MSSLTSFLERYRIRLPFIIYSAFLDLYKPTFRSRLGILWTILVPIFQAFLMTFFIKAIFNLQSVDSFWYILTGMIVWDIFSRNIGNSLNSLISSTGFIRQLPISHLNYPLRTSMTIIFQGIINFTILAFISLFYVLITRSGIPEVINIYLCFFILLLPLILVTGIFSSLIPLISRDLSQLIMYGVQMLFFFTPILIPEERFANSNLSFVLDFNPIAQIVMAVRHGINFEAFRCVWVFCLILSIIAYILNDHLKNRIAYEVV